jgi:hypothetical protein
MEAYLKTHKFEAFVQKAVMSLQGAQPANPYAALAAYVTEQCGASIDSELGSPFAATGKNELAGDSAADEEAKEGDDPAYDATRKFLAVGACGRPEGEVADYAAPSTSEQEYAAAESGKLTDSPPNLCMGEWVAVEAGEATAEGASGDTLGELIYFPVMAKGLQLAMIAEMSGLQWSGFTTEESGPKSWGELKPTGIAPFSQMPLLKTPGGKVIGQAAAIANYIAKKAGPKLEGATDEEFAMSQMCMREAEDIYSMLGKCELANWKTPEQRDSKAEEAKELFAESLPAHFANLEELASGEQKRSRSLQRTKQHPAPN